MKNQTPPAHLTGLRPDLTNLGLSPERRALVELMRKLQFGRVENMSIRAGQPILDRDVKVVRVARLAGRSVGSKSAAGDEFELKRPVRDLFDELARLQDGTVVTVEFRHGLPFLIEITAEVIALQNPS